MKDKRELHAWIDAELYYRLRAYAMSRYSNYRNWLGKAVEEAIQLLLEKHPEAMHTQQIRHGGTRVGGRAAKVLECIEGELGDIIADKTAKLLRAIHLCGGTDHRTVMKYLNLVQNHLGVRFHARTPCVFYLRPVEDVPLQTIRFDSVRKLSLLEQCTE